MRRYHYRRMSPAEISAELNRLGLTIGQLSRLWGFRYNGPDDSTVQKWLDGRQDPPAYLPALFALLSMPGAIETARAAIEDYIEEDLD